MKKTTSVTSQDMEEVAEFKYKNTSQQVNQCKKKKDFTEFCEQSANHYEVKDLNIEGGYIEVMCKLCKRKIVI